MWFILLILSTHLVLFCTVICSKRKKTPPSTACRKLGRLGDPKKPEEETASDSQPRQVAENNSDIIDSVKTRKKSKSSPKSAKDGSARKSETASYSSQIVVVPSLADKWDKNVSVTVPEEQRKAKTAKEGTAKKRVTFDTGATPSKKSSKTKTNTETPIPDSNDASKSEKG